MLRHQRALEGENHIRNANGHRCDLGDIPALLRADLEDSLVQALEDTHYDGKIHYFREWVQKNGRALGLTPEGYQAILHVDTAAWFTAHLMTCDLKRMGHRWEHSANRLWKEFGLDPSMVPQGTTRLGM